MVYTKIEALKEIFDIELNGIVWPSKLVTKETLLKVISKPIYNLKDDLGICAQSVSNLLKKIMA